MPVAARLVCRPLLNLTLRALVVAVSLAALPAFAAEVPPPPDVGAVPADAETTDSGLATRVLAAGSGESRPGEKDVVVIHYSAWTADGKLFDSSVAKDRAVRAPMELLMPGLREGLALMTGGEKRRLWIPGHLAYEGQEGKPQGMLVFDLELLEIARHPETPADVAAPPADAEIHKGGLASKVLRAGSGERTPKARDTVKVHYAGWTTDGEMFDTSLLLGKPASFRLNQVIKGWTQGLQLMVEGEKRRLWIPAKLAYKGVADKPQGMLVFDVELIEIE